MVGELRGALPKCSTGNWLTLDPSHSLLGPRSNSGKREFSPERGGGCWVPCGVAGMKDLLNMRCDGRTLSPLKPAPPSTTTQDFTLG